MSFACTRINNEPLSTSFLGNEQETNVFNCSLNKPGGTSSHVIADETRVVTDAGCAGKLDQRSDRLVPTGIPCQQPQKQDEAYAADTHPGKELSYSAVTRGYELSRHPVVEQTRNVWNTVSDPGAGSSEVNE